MLDELDPQQIALLIAEVQSEPWQHYDELGQWALTFSCTSRASNSEEKLKHHSAQGQLKKSSQASPGTPVFRSEIERKQSHGGRLLAEEKTQKKDWNHFMILMEACTFQAVLFQSPAGQVDSLAFGRLAA